MLIISDIVFFLNVIIVWCWLSENTLTVLLTYSEPSLRFILFSIFTLNHRIDSTIDLNLLAWMSILVTLTREPLRKIWIQRLTGVLLSLCLLLPKSSFICFLVSFILHALLANLVANKITSATTTHIG